MTLACAAWNYRSNSYLLLHFDLFRFMPSRFWDTKSSNIGNATNDIELKIEHLTVKSILYTLYTHEAQILFRFALKPCSSFQSIAQL